MITRLLYVWNRVDRSIPNEYMFDLPQLSQLESVIDAVRYTIMLIGTEPFAITIIFRDLSHLVSGGLTVLLGMTGKVA